MPVNILTKINGSIYIYIYRENYKKRDTFYSALKLTRLIDLRTFGISISMHIWIHSKSLIECLCTSSFHLITFIDWTKMLLGHKIALIIWGEHLTKSCSFALCNLINNYNHNCNMEDQIVFNSSISTVTTN